VQLRCYGHYQGDRKLCQACSLSGWCRNAGNPALTGGVSFESIADIIEAPAAPEQGSGECYTSGHWMVVLRRLLEIDDRRAREILLMKIENPDVSLSEIGLRYGISKQAIGKFIQKIEERFPELSPIWRNRPQYNKWRLTTCQPKNPRSCVKRRVKK